MGKFSEKFLMYCLVAMLLLIAMVEAGGAPNEPTICKIPLRKLSLCRPAVTGKYPPKPTEGCCGLLKQADLKCLCQYKDALPALEIDPVRAFALPKKCKLRTPKQCQV